MEIEALLKPEYLALPFATAALVQMIRQVGGKRFDHGVGARLLPMIPYLIAIPLALLSIGASGTLRDRILIGITAAAVSSGIYKFVRTTLLARGIELEAQLERAREASVQRKPAPTRAPRFKPRERLPEPPREPSRPERTTEPEIEVIPPASDQAPKKA